MNCYRDLLLVADAAYDQKNSAGFLANLESRFQ